MKLDWSVPAPLDYFASLVQDDASLPLLEAAISLGQDEEPQLDVQQVLLQVDALVQRLRRRVPDGADLLQRVQGLDLQQARDAAASSGDWKRALP